MVILLAIYGTATYLEKLSIKVGDFKCTYNDIRRTGDVDTYTA